MRIKFRDFLPVGRVGRFQNLKEDGTIVHVHTRDAFETAKWISDRLEYRKGGLFRRPMRPITVDELKQLYIEINPRNYLRFPEQIELLFEVESIQRMGFHVSTDRIVSLT